MPKIIRVKESYRTQPYRTIQLQEGYSFNNPRPNSIMRTKID